MAKNFCSGNAKHNSEPAATRAAAHVASAAFLLFLLLLASAAGAIISSTEASGAATVSVGISIPPLTVNQTPKFQNVTAPAVNGTNVSINLAISYNGTGLQNITMNLPSQWKKLTNMKVNESGVVKDVNLTGNQLTWEANLSAPNVTLIFDAAPPSLVAQPQFFNSTFFQKNLTVESDNSFVNVSVSIEVNTSFSFYTLFWHNGTDFVDKSVEFNLKVVDGTATFDSFSTSTVLFSIEGALSCTESWSCTGWSDSRQCGTRTCTDANHCGTTTDKPSESLVCPETPTAAGAGGGGGGGGAASVKVNATKKEEAPVEEALAAKHTLVVPVSDELINVFILPGEFKKASFRLTNTGEKTLKLDITVEKISSFVSLDTSYIELKPGESRTINLLVLVSKETQPDTYSGKIRASDKEGEAELAVNVLIQVAPLKSLFDALVNINQKTKSVLPGDSVVADIAMFNLVGAGRFDVTVIYGIKDYEGALITSKQQTVAVETRASITGILEVPRSSLPGQYYMFVDLMLNKTTVAVGSDTFEVLSPIRLGAKGLPETNIVFMAIMALIALSLLLSLISVVEIVSHHLPHRHAAATGGGVGGFGGVPEARKGFGIARALQILRKKPSVPSLPAVIEKGKIVEVKPVEAKPAEPEKGKTEAERETAAEKKEKEEEPEAPSPPVSREELDKKLRVLEQSFSAGLVSMKAYMEDKFKIEKELKRFQ